MHGGPFTCALPGSATRHGPPMARNRANTSWAAGFQRAAHKLAALTDRKLRHGALSLASVKSRTLHCCGTQHNEARNRPTPSRGIHRKTTRHTHYDLQKAYMQKRACLRTGHMITFVNLMPLHKRSSVLLHWSVGSEARVDVKFSCGPAGAPPMLLPFRMLNYERVSVLKATPIGWAKTNAALTSH